MHILKIMAELHTRHIPATSRAIAQAVGADEDVALARLTEFCVGGYVNFQHDGNLPTVDTPFFLTERAWRHISSSMVEM